MLANDRMVVGFDPGSKGGDNSVSVIVKIDAEGKLHCIWDDSLADLFVLGTGQIRRASHVEPTAGGEWEADLSPVDGPLLGPFRTRKEALEAEVAWLKENYLGVQNGN